MDKRFVLDCLLSLVVWVGLSTAGMAHPFHTSTAEMEFNAQTGRFEIALKIHASDYEFMLHKGSELSGVEAENQTSKSLKLTKKELLERHAVAYLERNFVVTVAGEACQLEWAGTEDESGSIWLYFELCPKNRGARGDLLLSNKLLCDHNKDQINTVVFLSKAGRVSFKTHVQSTTVTLPPLND